MATALSGALCIVRVYIWADEDCGPDEPPRDVTFVMGPAHFTESSHGSTWVFEDDDAETVRAFKTATALG